MPGIALLVHFDGEPDDLAVRFHAAATRYAAVGSAQPETALLLRNKAGIAVVLVWPDGESLQPFRTFLLDTIGELGLPHPRVEHMRASELTWDAITRRD